MSEKCEVLFKTDTLTLSQCPSGFWLWDETRGMNLSMRAKTERDAFVEALKYYQRRLKKVETSHNEMSKKIQAFIDSFQAEED